MIDIGFLCPDLGKLEHGEWSIYSFRYNGAVFNVRREDDTLFSVHGEKDGELVYYAEEEILL